MSLLKAATIRSKHLDACEVAWFAPICSDDYEYLGVPDPRLTSSFRHASDILLTAERLGFDNILCPSSYQVGQDTLTFAAGVAPMTTRLSLLVAVRCGEIHPPMLARALASLDHMLQGRLTVNIISSDLPGETASAKVRYQKSREVIEILKQCWNGEAIDHQGEQYKLAPLTTAPCKPYQTGGGPLLYFGGMAEEARELAAEHADVFLMWPETEERLAALMHDMSARAGRFDRRLDFGLRIHVIVRETEKEARAQAERLVSKLDDRVGASIKARALDASSLGVARQAEMRDMADAEGYVEPLLWTGVGRARSGCGIALVGDPDQIVAKLERYMDMGMRAFILSGYPHKTECELFARHVLPRLKTVKLAEAQGRIPRALPKTPLTLGEQPCL
jgi:alkanesulfonate monooxygenase